MSILVKKGTGKDEYWGNWFVCPACGNSNIRPRNSYCPDCGVELRWPKDMKKIDGYEGVI
jgi:predicted RNA-binding Zn-ribbon protein involved in translation (DUF1610 family)